MRLKLLNYNLSVSYKPGKYMYISDTLSRAFLKHKKVSDTEIKFAVHSVVHSLSMPEECKNQFRQKTTYDSQLKVVSNFIVNGWPTQKYKILIMLESLQNGSSLFTEN